MKLHFLALACAAALAACSQNTPSNESASVPVSASEIQANAEKITVSTYRGEESVPKNPERVAVLDWGMLDTLNQLGVEIGAATDESRVEYLNPIIKKAQPVGTLFEPDYEALNAYQPQLIIIGSRAAKAYDELKKIAPTIEMTADTKNMLASAKERVNTFAKIFDKEAQAKEINAKLDAAFDAAREAAKGKGNGLVVLVNGNKLSAYGNTSRLGGWIHQDIGVPSADPDIKEGSHGQPISFEYIKEKNPDWLFVLDRGAAIGEEGASAKETLNNPLVAETTAWKKGQVVYMVPENYLAAGGVQQLLNATSQLTEAFNRAH